MLVSKIWTHFRTKRPVCFPLFTCLKMTEKKLSRLGMLWVFSPSRNHCVWDQILEGRLPSSCFFVSVLNFPWISPFQLQLLPTLHICWGGGHGAPETVWGDAAPSRLRAGVASSRAWCPSEGRFFCCFSLPTVQPQEAVSLSDFVLLSHMPPV